jgi:hypothetical protein
MGRKTAPDRPLMLAPTHCSRTHGKPLRHLRPACTGNPNQVFHHVVQPRVPTTCSTKQRCVSGNPPMFERANMSAFRRPSMATCSILNPRHICAPGHPHGGQRARKATEGSEAREAEEVRSKWSSQDGQHDGGHGSQTRRTQLANTAGTAHIYTWHGEELIGAVAISRHRRSVDHPRSLSDGRGAVRVCLRCTWAPTPAINAWASQLPVELCKCVGRCQTCSH